MYKFILKKAVPLPKLVKMDNFLFVAPHPDDIEVGCGATVKKLAELGKKITFVIVTDGSGGALDENLNESEIVAIRHNECIQSAKLLGVDDVRFLNFVDGCTYGDKQIGIALAQLIVELQAEVVVCPDYKTHSEYHPDHLFVGEMSAFGYFLAQYKRVGAKYGLKGDAPVKALAYYYTDKPNQYVPIKKAHFNAKMQAIACHKSQFDDGTIKSFKTYFALRNARFGSRIAKRRAEGFRVLGNVHMHCMPEASEF